MVASLASPPSRALALGDEGHPGSTSAMGCAGFGAGSLLAVLVALAASAIAAAPLRWRPA
ncbi:hypothetical protein [Sorangium sp. So ce362]|uniref:hypothetical protein n=1 Tax=Sorangium sp. So ce362 TaxID=3133303 RepID=UPI003F648A7D